MLGALLFPFAYAGACGLCFAMERHHRQLFDRPPGRVAAVALRLVGVACLAACLACCVLIWGTAIGLVAWFGSVSLAAGVLVLVLAHAPSLAASLNLAALPLAALGFLVGS